MISIAGLTKTYGAGFRSVEALRGIDLEIGPGMFGLLGPNGAGKTTLMRILAGIVNPTRGTVVFSVAIPKTFQNTERGDARVPTDVDISVFNVRGQLTRALKRSSEMEPVLTMQWDGTYQDGTQAPSGIYFLRVKAGATETVRKIVLLR